MARKTPTLQELVQGIDSMLLKYSSTFTNDEVTLLNGLRSELQDRIADGNVVDAMTAIKVLNVLARVFGMQDWFE